VAANRELTTAARTHGQQAVPTTLGAKFAVYLAEVARQRTRLVRAREAVGMVSLFGGGGTSAALGASASEVRRALAGALGLRSTEIPWHVARDSLTEFGTTAASVSATCVRFAREIIDLSRTEVNEVAEPGGYQRGASSTMPQKANPITSEAIIGLGVTAGVLASALFRTMEAGHERAAGEWQIEWQVIPQIALLASSGLMLTGQLCRQLVVNPPAIAANLLADGGLLMSEALMMELAASLGRETAHEVVYTAAHDSRAQGRPIDDVLAEHLARDHPEVQWNGRTVKPSNYVGQAQKVCDAAVRAWRTFA
jgi:3-carboxy-cis,cis-muconate cycloisomerase